MSVNGSLAWVAWAATAAAAKTIRGGLFLPLAGAMSNAEVNRIFAHFDKYDRQA